MTTHKNVWDLTTKMCSRVLILHVSSKISALKYSHPRFQQREKNCPKAFTANIIILSGMLPLIAMEGEEGRNE
jgi:hypothetical protein